MGPKCPPSSEIERIRGKFLQRGFCTSRTRIWARILGWESWWPKSSCPPSKVCLPWVSKRGIWDVPGILLGYPGSLGVFRSLKGMVLKKYSLTRLQKRFRQFRLPVPLRFLRHANSYSRRKALKTGICPAEVARQRKTTSPLRLKRIRADFWEGDEDSNFSVFRVRQELSSDVLIHKLKLKPNLLFSFKQDDQILFLNHHVAIEYMMHKQLRQAHHITQHNKETQPRRERLWG